MYEGLDVVLIKLSSGEEIITLTVFDREALYIAAPRLVEKGSIVGKWITGMDVNKEVSNQHISKDNINAVVLEENIQPRLVQSYKEQIGLLPRSTRSRTRGAAGITA